MNKVLEVDIDSFNSNIDIIQKYSNKIVMPVIKANGYGTYINKNIDVLDRFDIVAVALVDEAIELRKYGFKKDIFVLNPIFADEISYVIKYDITVGVCDIDILKLMIKTGSKIKVHLEIETGMNRTGIKLCDLSDILLLLKNSNILVLGIYTHLSSADIDREYTISQLDKFKKAYLLASRYYDLKYIHSSSSCGLLNFDDGISNMVRPGLLIYGYKPFNCDIDVKPICKLKARIVFIKDVLKGDSISYSRSYIAKSDMRVATVQIGYADGIRRELSNKGKVVIDGKLCNIIGNICMDSLMVDVSDVNCKVGDYVYIFDNDFIKVDDIAKLCNTISYEILVNISSRVKRIAKKNN